MVETGRKLLSWAQALPLLGKAGVTLGIAALTLGLIICVALLVWQIWQSPEPDKPEPSATPASSVTILKDSAGASVGHISGVATSTGQTGGVNAGNYYQSPPATDQQKAEAKYKLESELGELADYPERIDDAASQGKSAPTNIQNMLIFRVDRTLFLILNRYYKETILSLERGVGLEKYKRDYYRSELNELAAEAAILGQIGDLCGDRRRDIEIVYLRYFIMRATNHSVDAMKRGEDFLTPWGIAFDKAEQVYQSLLGSNDPNVFALVSGIKAIIDLHSRAVELLSAFESKHG